MRPLGASPARETRIDLHLHSRASTDTGSWFLTRALLPESYTEPAAAYAAAKRRGMDMVTLTDHNTISGALEIAHHPDVLIGVEVTATFPGDRVPVHVLAWGVDEGLWDDMDRARADVHDLIALLDAADVPFALAHPLHRVGGDLTADHIERCLLLFPLWEGRNGARPEPTNAVACRIAGSAGPELMSRLADKHGIAPRHPGPPGLTGGSDDHGGFDIACAWTATPPAASPADLVAHLRAGRVTAHGDHGTGVTLAHSVGSLAAKGWLEGHRDAVPESLRGLVGDLLRHPLPSPTRAGSGDPPSSSIAEEVLGRIRADRRLVRRYRRLARDRDGRAAGHARLRLASGWLHEELLRTALAPRGPRASGIGGRAEALAGACTVALPYLLAAGYARSETRFAEALERGFLGPDLSPPGPVPVVMLTDTFSELNGVAGTMRHLAEYASERPSRGIRVLSCGAGLPATAGHTDLHPVADLPVPAYGDGSWRLGVPSAIDLLDVVEASGARVVHAATPGPLGLAGLLVARTLGLPFVVSHHTELARYALELTGDRLAAGIVDRAVGWFHSQAARVYVPTGESARGLVQGGLDPARLVRFTRGSDTTRFAPDRATRRMRRRLGGDGTVVLYVGRVSQEKGVLLLADAFRRAVAQRPDLRLAIVGDGPARPLLARALAGAPHRFLGPLTGTDLASAYASADLFCLPSSTETFGQVVTEAGASGLPTVVLDRGGAAELVTHGQSGLIVPAGEPAALAAAITLLHDDPGLRARLGAGARRIARGRPSWEEVFDDLCDGYGALVATPGGATSPPPRPVAA